MLTTRTTFADANLGKIYGLAMTGTDVKEIALDPQQRSGIYTQLAFLSAHADAGDSHPVKRSDNMVRRLLCVDLVVPDDIEVPPVAEPNATQTTRERFDVHGQAACARSATEVKPPVLADAIVEATETGSTLRANRLRILETVMGSNTQLIANRTALGDVWKRTKLENLALLLKAAIEAQSRVGLMLNVPRTDLNKVLSLLPALQRPTISPLSDEEWVAVNTIIEERTVRDLIPKLKAAGGQGIVEYPLNKIVL
jgi:ATP phosphoribosyltransferase